MATEIFDFDFVSQSALDVDGRLIRVSPLEYLQQKASLQDRAAVGKDIRELAAPVIEDDSALLKDKYKQVVKGDAAQRQRDAPGPTGAGRPIKKFSFRSRR